MIPQWLATHEVYRRHASLCLQELHLLHADGRLEEVVDTNEMLGMIKSTIHDAADAARGELALGPLAPHRRPRAER